MKTIGILTYWGVPNYGAWVQAYALNIVVRGIVGNEYEVRHLNYLCRHHWESYYLNDERLYNAFSYNWDIIPHTIRLDEESIEDYPCDSIICGSDSIWEFSIPEMGNDKHLVGNGLSAERIVSYAASFGVTSSDDSLEAWVKDGIQNLDSVIVRDTHSRDVIHYLCPNKDVGLALDPCLLYDFLNDDNVLDSKYKNYYAVYGVHFSDQFKDKIIRKAKMNRKKLISIGFVNDWCDISLRMIELRCLEWLGMVKCADCVVTSTFHGLMTSIAFEKQVLFDQVEYVKNRSQSLIELLGIDDMVGNSEYEIDYSVVTNRLNALRKESFNALNQALEIV